MSKRKRLIYIPLGGSGEIGMNLYLYGYGVPGREDFILVDAGVSFPNMDTTPGVDLIMPDISFVKENIERLLGIFITHGHEDHVGALGYLFSNISKPVYCREFTAALAARKLSEVEKIDERIITVESLPEMVDVGAFRVGFLPVSHSIPEASSLVIDTPIGRVLHTGDFKIDETPVLGDPFNYDHLSEIKKPGILASVCDSTNVFSGNHGRSEQSIAENLLKLISSQNGVVVGTTFASNIARLLTLARCARDSGRQILILGRAMHTMIATATASGILKNFPSTVSVDQALDLPRSKLFILATGSQGENRAASAQLARDGYMKILLSKGDSFLFSSKTIPGNELAVGEVINSLTKRGIKVFDESDGSYHVSGHANRPDLEAFHKFCEPDVIIPMHGESRHLQEHYNLAKSIGFNSLVVPNGSVLEIMKKGKVKIANEVAYGRQYLDGGNLIGSKDGIVKTRLQLASRGHVSVSLLFEEGKVLHNGIWVKSKGLPAIDKDLLAIETVIEDGIVKALLECSNKALSDDESVELIIQRTVNRICNKSFNKKPVTTIFINRLE